MAKTPNATVILSLRVPRGLRWRMHRAAKAEGLPMSVWHRRAIERALKPLVVAPVSMDPEYVNPSGRDRQE